MGTAIGRVVNIDRLEVTGGCRASGGLCLVWRTQPGRSGLRGVEGRGATSAGSSAARRLSAHRWQGDLDHGAKRPLAWSEIHLDDRRSHRPHEAPAVLQDRLWMSDGSQ